MFRKSFMSSVIVLALAVVVGLSGMAFANSPKYIFFFVGDGLGASQRQAAEYYLQAKNDDPSAKLMMNQFPVAGINTTHSFDSLVTDSAAAGTALATGFKTGNGMIGQLPDGTPVKTLVEAAEEKGMATGVVSTMRLTHATPASFSAHNFSRDNENEIAVDIVNSGIEFLAGGGYRHFAKQGGDLSSKRKDDRDLLQEIYNLDYNMFVTEGATVKFRNFQPAGKEKVFAAFTYSNLPYELDRAENKVPSLAEITAKGIQVLSQYEDGFFMMVEGGLIDYAGHSNDAASVVNDVLALDAAIQEAYEFYQAHPEETLILVVGDHETGGFGLGFGNNYFMHVDKLFNVNASMDMLRYEGDRAATYQVLAEKYGLSDLSVAEKAQLEKAMDMADQGETVPYAPSYLNAVNATVSHIISERVNVFWTTFAHTGTSIPMSAVGAGAEAFGGFKDNTEIAKTMAELLNVELGKK